MKEPLFHTNSHGCLFQIISQVTSAFPQALAVYPPIFRPQNDLLLTLYEAEDHYYGRMLGTAYAEIYRSASPLLVEDLTARKVIYPLALVQIVLCVRGVQ